MSQAAQEISPRQIQDQYTAWFESLIEQFTNKHKSSFETAEMFRARNGFFITISFDQNAKQQEYNGKRWTDMDRFSDLYNRICRVIVGRNFHRPPFKDELPLAIGCLDVNGTRYWRSMGPIENAHIHSIWLMTNETAGKFRELSSGQDGMQSVKEMHGIRNVDVQSLIAQGQRSNRLVGYTTKLIGHNNRDLSLGDDFRILGC